MHLRALCLLLKSVGKRVIIVAYLDFSRDFSHLFDIFLLTIYITYNLQINDSQNLNNSN